MKLEFINHLQKYLSGEAIKKLIDEKNNIAYNAILFDETKINIKDYVEKYPFLKPHPFVKNAYVYEKNAFEFGKTLEFELGAYYLLEPCSLMVNYFLNPTKDDVVLDCCASPGGKTIHCSFLMQNEGLIIANEINNQRALTLSSNIEKYGRKNIIVTNNDILDFKDTYKNTFTKIILDAPCSGSSMFRKDKKMEDDWSYEKVLRLQKQQKDIILKAYSLLAPNGIMVYSTCSFSYEEDEEVIKHLLENTDAELIPIKEDKHFYQSDLKGTIHLFPYLFTGEGHFIALITKSKGERNYLKKSKQEKVNIPYNIQGFITKNKDYINLASPYKIDGLKIIRDGLILGENNQKIGFIPHHHLSRCNSFSLPYLELTREETIDYIFGNTIKKNVQDGYYFLYYDKMPFAYTKVSKNTLKNHYPKGLRKRIR